MSTEKNKDPDKKQEKNNLDKQLDKTFPASDPPAHTRPGSRRDKDDEEDKS